METIELYVLSKNRSKQVVVKFLDEFLPDRVEAAEDYPYPEYSDKPECIYHNYFELIDNLQRNREAYSLYWNATNHGNIKTAMCFFTNDGGLILGLVVLTDEVRMWLEKLSKSTSAEYGYTSSESTPPESYNEFIERCKKSDQVRLIAGELLNK